MSDVPQTDARHGRLCAFRVEGEQTAKAYEGSVESGTTSSGLPQRKLYGQGRVAYIPLIQFDGPLPAPEPYFEIRNHFWKRPRNWEEITEAIRWAANGDIPLQIAGPDFLAANFVEQVESQRRLIHLVNYNAQHDPLVPSVDVSRRVPKGIVVREVTMYEVDSESPVTINFSTTSKAVAFTIPQVKTMPSSPSFGWQSSLCGFGST